LTQGSVADLLEDQGEVEALVGRLREAMAPAAALTIYRDQGADSQASLVQ
jgi:hypothetical protein